MKINLPIQSFRLHNFKSIRDSKAIKLNPLTVLIGNNGSGKSSVIEGLEFLQTVSVSGLDMALHQWHGYEHIRNKAGGLKPQLQGLRPHYTNPIRLELRGNVDQESYTATLAINKDPSKQTVFIEEEQVTRGRNQHQNLRTFKRDANGETDIPLLEQTGQLRLQDDESIMTRALSGFIGRWQFLSVIPQLMGEPVARRQTEGSVRLARDGRNLAEYLLEFLHADSVGFNEFITVLQQILPYAQDLQPNVVESIIEPSALLQMSEGSFKVPGWLLSSGTMRIAVLLAVLRHPNPPPVLIVDEIENGLDPKTVALLIEELQRVVQSGRIQVIATTHSPYLLDLLSLDHIILVERVENEPQFIRPVDQEELQHWSERFSPGQLYTMGRIHSEVHQ